MLEQITASRPMTTFGRKTKTPGESYKFENRSPSYLGRGGRPTTGRVSSDLRTQPATINSYARDFISNNSQRLLGGVISTL